LQKHCNIAFSIVLSYGADPWIGHEMAIAPRFLLPAASTAILAVASALRPQTRAGAAICARFGYLR
jgi:hypothetical protein